MSIEMPRGWHELRAYTEEIRGEEYPIDINIEASELMKAMAEALELYQHEEFEPWVGSRKHPARDALKKFKEWKNEQN